MEDGFWVTNVNRGVSKRFISHGCRDSVTQVDLDRNEPEFRQKIAALKPDVVVDRICFKESDVSTLIAALEGQLEHYPVTGSVWYQRTSSVVPNTEEEDLDPLGENGIEKSRMTRTLKGQYALSHFSGTIIHPGHVVGPGNPPINPQRRHNPKVFEALIHGELVTIPNLGKESVHHGHAIDVAGVFEAAIRAGSPN